MVSLTVGVVDPNDTSSLEAAPGDFSALNEEGDMQRLTSAGGLYLFIYLFWGFYIAFNTVQVISRRVVGRAEETSIYSWSRFCTVNCRPTASNYQLSHLRLCLLKLNMKTVII